MTISGMTMNENNYENLLLTGDSVCRELLNFERVVNVKGVVMHPDWIQKQCT